MSIEKITSEDGLSQSKNLIQENIEQLKKLFPEIVTEDKIDFKSLQQILGEEIEDEEEYYRFTWAGKSHSRREAHKPSTGTLRPCKEESLDWDTTQNLYIEGDNLEVLKLLQKSYSGKIKMIYIDPPYNTGKDFVYKDNYKDNLKNYQEITGQVDSDGNKLSTNSDSDGRYHSNWLNMMYPRLKLARNLLKDDGVIFLSIDDNEIHNLRKVSDEIFGENNFIAEICWHKKTQPSFLSKEISNVKEYILFYKKSKELITTKGGLTDVDKLVEMINISNQNADRVLRKENVIIKNETFCGELDEGLYGSGDLKIRLLEKTTIFNGKPKTDVKLNGRFKWTQETMNKSFNDGDTYYIKNINSLRPTVDRANKVANVKPLIDLFSKKINDSIATNTDATNELKDLFDGISPMDYPKPTKLIGYLIDSVCYDETSPLILDFFSGSATTAQATMKLNSEDGGNRKFIMVQIPEKIDNINYTTISEIGKERIRRAGRKIVEESGKSDLDIGFRVLKLDTSNIKSWDGNPENLESSLFDSVSNIKSDRTEEDVLYEILLKYGLDLTLPIEERNIQGKKVFNVGMGSLFICLSDEITSKVAESIGEWKEECDPEVCRVIFKDNGFTDVEKTNSVQILKRFGINEIRSI